MLSGQEAATHPLIDRLLTAIEIRNLTRREAAEEIGVSPRTIDYWAAGATKPQPKQRRSIVAWLESDEAAVA